MASVLAQDLWFAYEPDRPVLKGINLELAAGEFVGVVGQNGSGKTTLAKHFNGLLQPTDGRVLIHGESVAQRPTEELAREVGYVFQNPDHQIFSATVREELAFGPKNLGREDSAPIDETLHRFGLHELADTPPASLSFGLRRKVSVAAIFTMDTPILILDEPTSGLDTQSSRDLMEIVRQRSANGHIVILITHDMQLVAEYADRCILIHQGQVLFDGLPRALFCQHELLRQTGVQAPQASVLAAKLAPWGFPQEVLTASEFCQAYASWSGALR